MKMKWKKQTSWRKVSQQILNVKNTQKKNAKQNSENKCTKKTIKEEQKTRKINLEYKIYSYTKIWVSVMWGWKREYKVSIFKILYLYSGYVTVRHIYGG